MESTKKTLWAQMVCAPVDLINMLSSSIPEDQVLHALLLCQVCLIPPVNRHIGEWGREKSLNLGKRTILIYNLRLEGNIRVAKCYYAASYPMVASSWGFCPQRKLLPPVTYSLLFKLETIRTIMFTQRSTGVSPKHMCTE